MDAHFASDTGLKARLRSATNSPRIPFRHSKPGQLPLTYDMPIPRHTAAGIFGLGAMDRSIPRVRRVDLNINRIAVPVPRENSVTLRNRVRVQRAHVPATRKVPAAPGAFFPGMGMMEMGMGGLGAYPSPFGTPPPGTQWMQKHGHRRYQVDGLGSWFRRRHRRSSPSTGSPGPGYMGGRSGAPGTAGLGAFFSHWFGKHNSTAVRIAPAHKIILDEARAWAARHPSSSAGVTSPAATIARYRAWANQMPAAIHPQGGMNIEGLDGFFSKLFRHSSTSSGATPSDSYDANVLMNAINEVRSWAARVPAGSGHGPGNSDVVILDHYRTWVNNMPSVLRSAGGFTVEGLGEDYGNNGMWQMGGLGAFTAHKLRARPPRIIGVPRTTKVGTVPAMGHARNFIPGLGEEDAGDTLEMGTLNAFDLAADASPSASAPGAGAMKNMMLIAAGAFALGMWLRSR